MKYVFIHIPKCAGSTFSTILDKNMNTYSITNLDEPGADLIETSVACIRGHISFDYAEKSGINQPKYICFFRHPVQRSLSWFYYAHQHDKERDINRFINDDRHPQYNYMFNAMSCQLGNVSRTQRPSIDSLYKALENLRLIDYVCITEEFESSLQMLKDSGVLSDITHTNHNVTKNKPDINTHSKDLLQSIYNKNYYDIIIYLIALGIFQKRIEKNFSESVIENAIKAINKDY